MKSTSTDFVLKYLGLALLLASKFINILQVCTPTIFAPTIFAPTIFAVGLALEKSATLNNILYTFIFYQKKGDYKQFKEE